MSTKPRYVSKAERQSILTLDALGAHLINRVLPQAHRYGPEVARRWRTAATHLAKGLRAWLDGLAPEDRERFLRESSTTRVILTSEAYVPRPDSDAGMDVLYTLAEHAIGTTCRGCTRDPEACDLRRALVAADVPYSTTEPERCPYEMPGVEM
ncbi:DUF5651 domain-containing protein [Alicyclobacillus macrosporangiidus]|uniref:DUF5651 domain-containing protein n=1 Tax=Alicyclobacillus macrosporangiidus TaxID=392015 RepID=A0A1I7ICJ8_9BACL|nr:DUF5651 domain-containing protein [Alicyclobacillus macrosporangiidus]SFU70682.1 hypothetical protein SAMN05421543_106136 [Alicyclobacillus macrosporangiidus]